MLFEIQKHFPGKYRLLGTVEAGEWINVSGTVFCDAPGAFSGLSSDSLTRRGRYSWTLTIGATPAGDSCWVKVSKPAAVKQAPPAKH